MHLALELFNNNLSRIEIPQPIPQPLSTPHGNQDHPVIVSDKGLGMGVTVMQKMNAFGGYTVFLLSVTFGVIGHHFQALGVSHLLIQKMLLPLVEPSSPLLCSQLLPEYMTNAARHTIRWRFRLVGSGGLLLTERGVHQIAHHRQMIGVQSTEFGR